MCKASVVVVGTAITQISVQVPHFQIAGSEYAKEDIVYYAVVQSTAVQVHEGVHVLQHDSNFHMPGKSQSKSNRLLVTGTHRLAC